MRVTLFFLDYFTTHLTFLVGSPPEAQGRTPK